MTEPQIFVRVAVNDEQQLIKDFVEKSRVEASAYRGHMDFRPPATSDEEVTFVAGVGNTIFGALSAYDAGLGRWFIDLLYVVPEAREIGIGNELVQFALVELRSRQAKSINAAALPGDRSTKNLFERHGLVAQMITVGKQL